jgi:hypothetical protein
MRVLRGEGGENGTLRREMVRIGETVRERKGERVDRGVRESRERRE